MFTTQSNGGPVRWAWDLTKRFRTYGAAALAGILLFTLAGDVRASGYTQWKQRVIVEAAIKSTVPPELALAVARAGEVRRGERFDGRVGVMRISSEVALGELGVRAHGLRSPKANAGIGVTLLERLYRRYGERWDLALSHYRSGPLVRCESGPVSHERTLGYVADVMEWWRHHQKDEKVAALIEDVRQRGVRASRFSEDKGQSVNQFREVHKETNRTGEMWYDVEVRIEPLPFGESRPCCVSTRFF